MVSLLLGSGDRSTGIKSLAAIKCIVLVEGHLQRVPSTITLTRQFLPSLDITENRFSVLRFSEGMTIMKCRCYSGGLNFELGFADFKVQVEVVRIADKRSSTEPT